MTQKNTTRIIIAVIILIVLGLILLTAPKTTPKPETNLGEELETDKEATSIELESLVPGASPVSEKGEVLTTEGKATDNAAIPGSPDAPKQSASLKEEEIPEEAVKISVSTNGFTPNEFKVKAKSAITLSLTSTDMTHVFKFDDPVLQAIAIGVGGKETRAITFNAPSAGDYTFYCDVPGHRGRGETGVMHVE